MLALTGRAQNGSPSPSAEAKAWKDLCVGCGDVASGAAQMRRMPGMLAGTLAIILEAGEGALLQVEVRAGMLLNALAWRAG
jgi:hypothetical protein